MEYIIFWIIFSALVGIFASSQKRSGFGWFLAALLISPLISFVILLAVGVPKIEGTDMVTVQSQQPISKTSISSISEPNTPTKSCPFCAELIKQAAIVCRYCGRDLIVQDDAKTSLSTVQSNNESHKKIVKGSPEERLINGIILNNWGKVNSAIMLGADLSVKQDGKTISELACDYSDNSIKTLIARSIKPESKLQDEKDTSDIKKIRLSPDLAGTKEEKLINGILSGNWGKVNSAIILGADIKCELEGVDMLELSKQQGDASITSLIGRHLHGASTKND